MNLKRLSQITLAFVMMMGVLSGCQKATYTENNIISSLKEICLKEYNIKDVEVKISGQTIGVFLPLEQLFIGDVRKMILSGQPANIEQLFTPQPEAMDKVENVLFAVSRVVLSTDKDLQFYRLYASDVGSTGIELVLTGYVPDIRRLRLWDIPRSEYRKRVLNDLKLNRDILWQKPVRKLFEDVTHVLAEELLQRYFAPDPSPEVLSSLFYKFLDELKYKQNLKVELKEIKSRPYNENQGLVYVKLVETYQPTVGKNNPKLQYPSGTELEYIFIVDLIDEGFKIVQVIPFYFIDEQGKLQKINFPRELDLYKNLELWNERFQMEGMNLGEFIAVQLNRRVQTELTLDERVRMTIRKAHVNFTYNSVPEKERTPDQKPYFSLQFDFLTKDMKTPPSHVDQMIKNEDVLYVFERIMREFVDLVRSYDFKDFSHFELVWETQGPTIKLDIAPERLESYRRNKLDISALLKTPFGSFPPT